MNNTPWSEAEDDFLRGNYGMTVEQLCESLGRTPASIYRRGRLLDLRRPREYELGETSKLILAAASRPNGVCRNDEITSRSCFDNLTRKLKNKGLVFVARRYGMTRYFTTAEAAEACEKRIRAENPPKMWAVRIAAGPKFDHDAPLIFTDKTKYTRCPSPPERVLRTNTFTQF